MPLNAFLVILRLESVATCNALPLQLMTSVHDVLIAVAVSDVRSSWQILPREVQTYAEFQWAFAMLFSRQERVKATQITGFGGDTLGI